MTTVSEKHVVRLHPGCTVEIPSLSDEVRQDHEWCTIILDGQRQTISLHEYDKIYNIPGLYECLFYDHLHCDSPRVVCQQLEKALQPTGVRFADLRILDFGAGNGIVGEELRNRGASLVIGSDILPEARQATLRDRPGTYRNYVVADFTALPESARRLLASYKPNCLVQVAGLGFGDIPVDAFTTAWNLIETPGWIAFNIKEDFLDKGEPTGFNRLIRQMIDNGTFEVNVEHRYRHRDSLAGTPLHYVVLAGQKRADI